MKLTRFVAIVGGLAEWCYELITGFIGTLVCPVPMAKWRLERNIVGRHAGIAIVDFKRGSTEAEPFLTRTVQALGLVQQIDRLRFGRVQRQLNYIVRRRASSAFTGRYSARLGVCEINFTRLKFDDYPNGAAYIYAAILVHEATHGAIDNGEIPLSEVSNRGTEYYCDSEAAAFIRRWKPQLADIWMKKYREPARMQRHDRHSYERLRSRLRTARPPANSSK